MKKAIPFRGAGTALITPMKNGRPDKPAFRALIRSQCDAGIDALIVCGTTGEAAALTPREHTSLTALARETADPSVPVIAGCGSPSTKTAADMAREVCAAGADGLLCVTPYYNKCTEEGLYRHFMTVAEAAALPLILYEVPSRTGVRVSPKICTRLAAQNAIAAVKDASGDLSHTAEILYETGGTLAVYSGDDALTLPILSLGGAGVISVLSNVMPAEVHRLCALWEAGERAEAAALQRSFLPLCRALFSHVNPVPVKAVLAAMGVCREEYRLPLCPLTDEEKAAVLEPFGIRMP